LALRSSEQDQKTKLTSEIKMAYFIEINSFSVECINNKIVTKMI
jgi:hypothetical protein